MIKCCACKQVVSNDEMKSVEHRIVIKSTQDARVSIALFFNPAKRDKSDLFGTSPGAGDIRKACTVPEFHSAGVHEFKEGTRSYRIVHRTIQGEIESIVRRDVDEFGDEASMLALVCLSR